MPDAHIPASPDDIQAFLKEIMPIVEGQAQQAIDNSGRAVDAHIHWIKEQVRRDREAYELQQFWQNVTTGAYFDEDWAHMFGQWMVHVVRAFVAEQIDNRLAGMSYPLPAGLLDQFRELTAEDRQQLFAHFTRPVLQVGRSRNNPNAITLRQIPE